MAFGLLAILSVLALEMLPLRGLPRGVVWTALDLSIFLLAAANFSITWMILLVVSVVLLVYFVTVERGSLSAGTVPRKRDGVLGAGILAAAALLFVFNPVVSSTSGTVSNVIANFLEVSNTDVRPTLSATLEVS